MCFPPQYITIFFHLTTYLQTIVREAKVCSSMFSFSLPYTTIYISVYSRENVKTSKSDDGPMQNLLKNISTDNLLSGSLMSKTQFLPPQKFITLKHRCALTYVTYFGIIGHFGISAFSRVEPLLLSPHHRQTDEQMTNGRTHKMIDGQKNEQNDRLMDRRTYIWTAG